MTREIVSNEDVNHMGNEFIDLNLLLSEASTSHTSTNSSTSFDTNTQAYNSSSRADEMLSPLTLFYKCIDETESSGLFETPSIIPNATDVVAASIESNVNINVDIEAEVEQVNSHTSIEVIPYNIIDTSQSVTLYQCSNNCVDVDCNDTSSRTIVNDTSSLSTTSCYTEIKGPFKFYYIDDKKLTLTDKERVFVVYIRPDVTEDNVLLLLEQLLFAYGVVKQTHFMGMLYVYFTALYYHLLTSLNHTHR